MLGIYALPKNDQRGFTLIEMSIVLIIIGLIIGGILKGQEVIESSRLKAVSTQIGEMRAAINTFADKYGSLPGDYLRASERLRPNMVDGSGDGIIGAQHDQATALATEPANTEEHVEFWNQLAAARLISGTRILTNSSPDFFGEGSPFPESDIPGSGLAVLYGNYDTDVNIERRTHWLRIQKNLGDTGRQTEALSPKMMHELDIKIDDGIGTDGTTRVLTGNGTPVGSCVEDSTGEYLVFDDEVQCVGYFEMLE